MMPLQRIDTLRWIVPLLSAVGALLGIAGTAVLAIYPTQVATVFVLYLISNLAWIAAGFRTKQWWLLMMNLTYMSLGIYGLMHH